MIGFSTLVNELEPNLTSSDQPTHKCIQYHHPQHKSRRNDNNTFKYL
jgi:hypothetical protein